MAVVTNASGTARGVLGGDEDVVAPAAGERVGVAVGKSDPPASAG